MSNLDPRPDELELRASVVHAVDVIEARKAAIGDGTEVRRLLPARALRTVGAWCFLDHYGPDDVSAGPACGCRRTRTPACRRRAGCSTVLY